MTSPETAAGTARTGPVLSRFRFTSAADGSLAIGGDVATLAARRRQITPLPWTWLRQVHGADVVVVEAPGDGAGVEADAAVTARPGAALAVHTADCAPIAFLSPEGVVGAAHAGWRGLASGVLGATVRTMEDLGATDVRAVLGPCIHAECYEFGAAELDRLADRFGAGIRATTAQGTLALDLPAAVRAALREAGVRDADIDVVDTCTACDTGYFSHRARGDVGRQALVVWTEPA